VLTGGFQGGKESVEKLIEIAGGECVGSLSQKVNYLIVGDNPGSKLQKADELGIIKINLEELKIML
jgi:DNA ligase (NAD+)